MIIKKNITFVFLKIWGQDERFIVSRKSDAWVAETDSRGVLFECDTYKKLIATLQEYENLSK